MLPDYRPLAAIGLALGLGLTGLLNVSLTAVGVVAGLAGAAVSGRGLRRGQQVEVVGEEAHAETAERRAVTVKS